MKAAELLAMYDRVADAPDAVQKLRKLVLDLAVRGRLVQQDASEEPAIELLKRSRAAKERRSVVERRGTSRRISSGPSPLLPTPRGWERAALSDIVAVLNGRAYKKAELLATGTPVLRVGNLFTSDKWYYSNLLLDDDKYCQEGDLLFAWSASFGPFIWTGERAIYHYHIWKLAFYSEADFCKRYLYTFLLQKTRELKESGHGISMLHLTKEAMERVSVPVPPLAEQHRIVAKVDELMALCDQLEAARKEREAARDRLAAASLARLNTPDPNTFQSDARFALNVIPALSVRPDQVKQLRQTILNLAVRGKLVPQDRRDEPADVLLRQVAAHKALARGAESMVTPTITPLRSDAMLWEAPEGWAWAAFGDIVVSRDAERVPVSKEERASRAKLYDYYGASGVIDKIDSYLFDKPLLLIGEDGANLINRSTPIAFIARGKYWVNNHAHVIDGISEAFLRYLELYINATDLKPFVTGTAQPKMNQAKMNTIPVAIPPLAEQERIVKRVGELMVIFDQLDASLLTGTSARSRLLEALLHRALDYGNAEPTSFVQLTEASLSSSRRKSASPDA